jgi:hypothetical protein
MGPNATVSHLQFIQYSKHVVNQTGGIDTGKQTIIPSTLKPSIHHDHSLWQPFQNTEPAKWDESLLSGGMVGTSKPDFCGSDNFL